MYLFTIIFALFSFFWFKKLLTDNRKQRKVLVLKGFVHGIPPERYDEAFQVASDLVESEDITSLWWDGDKFLHLTYVPTGETVAVLRIHSSDANIFTVKMSDGIHREIPISDLKSGPSEAPLKGSFTGLITMLMQKYPHLELIFGKKMGSAKNLIKGIGDTELNSSNMLFGPCPFMNTGNTMIKSYTDPVPAFRPGHHLGIEFPSDINWRELGVEGLKYIKNTLGVTNAHLLVCGLGNTVDGELEQISRTPTDYPEGVTREKAIIIEFER